MNSLLDTPLEFLKGVGSLKAGMLQKELSLHTFGDLLLAYPFRYVDKTRFHNIGELYAQHPLPEGQEVQIKGTLRRLETIGEGRKKRLVGTLRDETGAMELVWFQGIYWLERMLAVGKQYVAFGRLVVYRNALNIPHPEVEELSEVNKRPALTFAPVYSSTEKLNAKGLDARGRRRLMEALFEKLDAAIASEGIDKVLPENLPQYLREKLRLPPRYEALRHIHFPQNQDQLEAALRRLKFEELFFLQLRLLQSKLRRKQGVKGHVFSQVGALFRNFYEEVLPFQLTQAQKRVIKEIRADVGSGAQMNRLLQGDVGSGKTIVALMCMLLAIDNAFQACLMAPTEILAQQHLAGIASLVEELGLRVDFLSGNIKGKKRKTVLEALASGQTHLLIGTHALIEDWVVFKNLGLAITDEQHRFGVAQRAALWKKNKPLPPHVLVMTATPIPRTLAMTLYGDLDVSAIDELPPGRIPVTTVHRTERHRIQVFDFMRAQIAEGRQVYVVYPLIEESEKLDLKNLMEGYEALSRTFPIPDYQLSIVHGRMKPADKAFEMERFVKGQTQIMVATTVIEVGVNVPNATVMVIENTERFGLSQIHQLRGRVGRGADKSYCILMTETKVGTEARERIQTLVRSSNGFEIAEADLRLRGPGNIEGTQQSGLLQLRLADLTKDTQVLTTARDLAIRILEKDPELKHPLNAPLKDWLDATGRHTRHWGLIS